VCRDRRQDTTARASPTRSPGASTWRELVELSNFSIGAASSTTRKPESRSASLQEDGDGASAEDMQTIDNPFGSRLTGMDLREFGEPGRIRTSDPLIKSQLLYH
jgi:hypothetical protein